MSEKRARAVLIRDEDIDDVETEQSQRYVTDADSAAVDFLDKAMSEGNEAKITIKRVLSDTSTMFCEQVPVDRYDFYSLQDYIGKTYGGGEYRLFITKKGVRGLLQNILIKIAERKQADEKTGQVISAPRNDISLAILEELRRSNERQNNAADPMEAFTKMMPIMGFFREMMQVQQPKNQLKEMAETMAILREMREFSGGNDSEPSVMGMLGQALPALIGAATRPTQTPIIRQTMKPNPARPSNPQAIPMAAPKPEPKTVEPELPAMLKELTPPQIEAVKGYLNQACLAASFGADPEKIAVKILESVEDEAMLKIIAETADLVDQAAKIVPDVTKHRDWFNDLQEWVKGHLGLPSKFADQFEDDQTDEGEADEPNGETLTNE